MFNCFPGTHCVTLWPSAGVIWIQYVEEVWAVAVEWCLIHSVLMTLVTSEASMDLAALLAFLRMYTAFADAPFEFFLYLIVEFYDWIDSRIVKFLSTPTLKITKH